MLDLTSTGTWGSPHWLQRKLLETLERARAAMREAYDEASSQGTLGWDPDHYVFLHIPRAHRKLWQLLRELTAEVDWIDVDHYSDIVRLTPGAGEYTPAFTAAARILNEDGINAYITESFR